MARRNGLAAIIIAVQLASGHADAAQRAVDDTFAKEFVARIEHALARGANAAGERHVEGEIFTPATVRGFRAIITEVAAVRRESRQAFTDAHAGTPRPRAAVNGRLPAGAGHFVTPTLLAAFPPLPRRVEYRIVGDDLVLWNTVDDVVIDVLRDAFAGRSA
jgi:hypothetical protein